ncbi:MAG: glycoside hydrolase family 3 C-terminal domain-containing protein [Tannerellaceae bacterium]|jgi:beta-glucosidase|nr:glycoside hydrolase family 3 C-terminal domain-containing protein [Tannerellaceae bacterium]
MKFKIKFKFLLPVCLTGIFLLAGCAQGEKARQSKLIANDARIDEIIAGMTLEEKIAMLHGKHMFTSEGIPRLGIPEMIYADGPFGIREEMEPNSWNPLGLSNDSSTFFPTGSALAATWSQELAYAYGTGMAREARLRGKDMLLGPAINIQRLPTGGRTYEYLSEDPFLSARLSVGYTLGVQDNGVAVCLKHFALNNQEQNRGMVDVIVSPRTMREIYLPPFEAAVVEGDAYGVMAAYNKVAGYWCSENDVLQNRILRDEWGFRGLIVSDWGGTHSTVNAALYGLDVEMPGGRLFGQALLDTVRAGAVPIEVIDQKVKNILRVRFAIDPIPPEQANATMTAKPEQAQIAYDIAAKSIVLLKNEGSLLPLDLGRHKKIAVIGENAVRTMALGGVGAGVKAWNEITPLAGLAERIGDRAELIYAQGYKGYTKQEREQWRDRPTPYRDADAGLLAEAVEVARNADIVLFIGGDNREVQTEGSDRTAITLPSGQDQVIEALAAVNPNIATILVTGAPLDLRVAERYSPALVVSWFNGSEGGHALADVLLGAISPSGKLPFTFPVKLEDSPAYALGNYPQIPPGEDIFLRLMRNQPLTPEENERNKAYYSEEMLVGYRWFDTRNVEPLYPFGHGLSYATFDYDNLATSKATYRPDDDIRVSFDLTNAGATDADEVVQLYVSRIGATVEWPLKELKAFQRISLKAGQTQRVTLSFPVDKLRYWDEDAYGWQLESSDVDILVGSSSRDIRLTKRISI